MLSSRAYGDIEMWDLRSLVKEIVPFSIAPKSRRNHRYVRAAHVCASQWGEILHAAMPYADDPLCNRNSPPGKWMRPRRIESTVQEASVRIASRPQKKSPSRKEWSCQLRRPSEIWEEGDTPTRPECTGVNDREGNRGYEILLERQALEGARKQTQFKVARERFRIVGRIIGVDLHVRVHILIPAPAPKKDLDSFVRGSPDNKNSSE